MKRQRVNWHIYMTNGGPVVQSDAGVGIGMGWGGVGPHGRGPLGAQRDPMAGDPWEWEPLGANGIPWEGTHGSGNPWEPKGSHGRGSRTPHGR